MTVGGFGSLVVGVGILALGVLAALAIWLARRTHRYLNVPLTAATVLVASALSLAITHIAQVSSTMSTVADGDYRAAVSLAQARAAAYDAKANESLTLIARGSGSAYESAYAESVRKANEALGETVLASPGDNALQSRFHDYTNTHAKIRGADDDGDWNAAVELAHVDRQRIGELQTFSAFDESASKVLSTKLSSIVAAFDKVGGGLLPIIVGLASALAALLAGRSMSKRIEEYR